MSCSNNVKQVALGLLAYHEVYGQFPPACTLDANGRPMHSWRILLLPYIEQQSLYDQYDFDEAWDGPHNRQLAEKIPNVYRCPSYEHHKEHEHRWSGSEQVLTQYVALRDEASIFPSGRSRRLDAIADGPDQTLLVVELHQECVHWMSPFDIGPDAFARGLLAEDGGDKNHPGGTMIAMADGSVHFLPETIDREKLIGLSNINGGESIEDLY